MAQKCITDRPSPKKICPTAHTRSLQQSFDDKMRMMMLIVSDRLGYRVFRKYFPRNFSISLPLPHLAAYGRLEMASHLNQRTLKVCQSKEWVAVDCETQFFLTTLCRGWSRFGDLNAMMCKILIVSKTTKTSRHKFCRLAFEIRSSSPLELDIMFAIEKFSGQN